MYLQVASCKAVFEKPNAILRMNEFLTEMSKKLDLKKSLPVLLRNSMSFADISIGLKKTVPFNKESHSIYCLIY